MKRILMAMISGKSREEVFDMLTEEEKSNLFNMAGNMGIPRSERRRMKRKYTKGKKSEE